MATFTLTAVPSWLMALILMPLTAAVFVGITLAVRGAVGKRVGPSHNDVVGFSATAAGVVYAVVVAFVLFAVWQRYEVAQDLAGNEAAAVIALSRDVQTFDEPQRGAIQSDLAHYARAVIDRDWPDMGEGRDPDQSQPVIDTLYRDLATTVPTSEWQTSLHQQAFSQLGDLSRERSERVLASRGSLPPIFWWVLFGSDLVVLALSVLLYLENAAIQVTLIAGLALVMGAMLFLIIALDQPFIGSFHIEPAAMTHAAGVIATSAS